MEYLLFASHASLDCRGEAIAKFLKFLFVPLRRVEVA